MIIVQYPQQVDAQMLRKQIFQLENSVWGTGDPKLDNCFPTQPDTYVTSPYGGRTGTLPHRHPQATTFPQRLSLSGIWFK